MKEIKERLIVSAIGILLLIVFIPLSVHPYFRPVFAAGVAVLIAIALWEYLQIVKAKGFSPSTRLTISFAVLYAFARFIRTQHPLMEFLPSLVLGVSFVFIFFSYFQVIRNALVEIAIVWFGLMYIAVTLSGMFDIVYFFPEGSGQDGRWWLVYLIAVTKMTDVGGYFAGKAFGKDKLVPLLSPGKTVQGAIGGTLFAILTSLGLSWLASWQTSASLAMSVTEAICLGGLLGVFAQLGDLAESLLKRDAGVKHSNIHLPGLGGILDTVDALIFTTPIIVFYLKVFAFL